MIDLLGCSMLSWLFRTERGDRRSRRVVFLIECHMNQNARDQGAAESPAVNRALIDLLMERQVGMAQIRCPEIACLGFARLREPGQSIREALSEQGPAACCAKLAAATADRIQSYLEQAYEVLAVLGGNAQSPACAIHDQPGSRHLADSSGIFMQALAEELAQRGLHVPFRGMRDVDSNLLKEDLTWLLEHL